jgi:hypothetical protein
MIWVRFFNTSMYYEAGTQVLFVIVSPTTLPHDKMLSDISVSKKVLVRL